MNEDRSALFGAKQNDYATGDALSNFKRMRAACALFDINPARSAEDNALYLGMLKLDRYCNLRGREPQNEGVRDTVLDWHNYIDLAYANRCEEWQIMADVVNRAKEMQDEEKA